MRPLRFELDGHRSVDQVVFDVGPFTVLFGKNNAGKTNILEAVYGLLSREERPLRRSAKGRPSEVCGGFWVDLEAGLEYDEAAASALSIDLRMSGHHWVRISLHESACGDPFGWTDADNEPESYYDTWCEGVRHTAAEGAASPHVLFLDWQFENLHEPFAACVARLAATDLQRKRSDGPWLECDDGDSAYRVPPRVHEVASALAALTTDLLPDFVEGVVSAHVTSPAQWDHLPKVILDFDERGATQCSDVVELAGSGAARWIAAAVQIAIHLIGDYPDLTSLRHTERHSLSGHVLLLDEPEAHLHPSAVASIVRWCHRMVRHGMIVLVASHHEEFLRASGEGATLVHVTRNEDMIGSTARTLETTATHALQELAADVGMHPAAALSLHRAVLFVEGTLDVAVLDEFAGGRLDAAGVILVPVNGTKNLEGLVSGEIVTRLGLRIGILTDATDVPSIASRPRKRLSSEEKKVLRILDLASEKGLAAPEIFGVAEDDLLFALPTEGVEAYLARSFPDWGVLVAEARATVGALSSDSVNWKQHAFDRYGLPITDPAGVREVVRFLDLAAVPMLSLERVVAEIVNWANAAATKQ